MSLTTVGYVALYALLFVVVVFALAGIAIGWFVATRADDVNDVEDDEEWPICESCHEPSEDVAPVTICGATTLVCPDCAPPEVA